MSLESLKIRATWIQVTPCGCAPKTKEKMRKKSHGKNNGTSTSAAKRNIRWNVCFEGGWSRILICPHPKFRRTCIDGPSDWPPRVCVFFVLFLFVCVYVCFFFLFVCFFGFFLGSGLPVHPPLVHWWDICTKHALPTAFGFFAHFPCKERSDKSHLSNLFTSKRSKTQPVKTALRIILREFQMLVLFARCVEQKNDRLAIM